MATDSQIFVFRAKFPELAGANDPDVAEALDTAAVWVDDRIWSVRDFPLALLYWAAHFLTLKLQQLASVQLSGGGGTGVTNLFLRSIAFGERRIMFGERKSVASAADKMLGPGEALLNETIYGQLYLALRSRNVIPVAVV
jgi:hypothetical protein